MFDSPELVTQWGIHLDPHLFYPLLSFVSEQKPEIFGKALSQLQFQMPTTTDSHAPPQTELEELRKSLFTQWESLLTKWGRDWFDFTSPISLQLQMSLEQLQQQAEEQDDSFKFAGNAQVKKKHRRTSSLPFKTFQQLHLLARTCYRLGDYNSASALLHWLTNIPIQETDASASGNAEDSTPVQQQTKQEQEEQQQQPLPSLRTSLLWGCLTCDLLSQHWLRAAFDWERLRQYLTQEISMHSSPSASTARHLLQLLHYALFVFLKSPPQLQLLSNFAEVLVDERNNGIPTHLFELMLSSAPHLLSSVAVTAVILHAKKPFLLQRFIQLFPTSDNLLIQFATSVNFNGGSTAAARVTKSSSDVAPSSTELIGKRIAPCVSVLKTDFFLKEQIEEWRLAALEMIFAERLVLDRRISLKEVQEVLQRDPATTAEQGDSPTSSVTIEDAESWLMDALRDSGIRLRMEGDLVLSYGLQSQRRSDKQQWTTICQQLDSADRLLQH